MSIVLMPFQILWSVVGLLLGLTGRLVLAVIGLSLIIAGMVLSITVIGAIIGIPLALLGFMLLLRSLF